MNQLLKRWRLQAFVVLAVVMALGTGLKAVASTPGQPGESSNYTPENLRGLFLQTVSDRAEARNGGRLFEVWRGLSDNRIWMSIDNGSPFTTAQSTATTVAPTVVPWGSTDFMVIHTGTDGRIYFNFFFIIDDTHHGEAGWQPIRQLNGSYQTTFLPVSAVQLGPNSGDVFMVYLSSNGDHQVWGTFFDVVSSDGWSDAARVNVGLGISAPSISYVPEGQTAARIDVSVVGLDQNIWNTQQFVGDNIWSPWIPLLNQGQFGNEVLANGPIAPGAEVHTAVNENSDGSESLVMAVLDNNHQTEFASFDIGMPTLSNGTRWTVDLSHFQSNQTPNLTSSGNSTFSLITGLDELGYWKQAFHK